MNVLVAGNQVLRLVQSGFDEVKNEKLVARYRLKVRESQK